MGGGNDIVCGGRIGIKSLAAAVVDAADRHHIQVQVDTVVVPPRHQIEGAIVSELQIQKFKASAREIWDSLSPGRYRSGLPLPESVMLPPWNKILIYLLSVFIFMDPFHPSRC